ncbi:ribosome-inactivating family protein [Rhizobacter sp. P5_C2]
MMFTLRVAPDWAEQIRKIREAVTEETHLIRADNRFYRVCRAGDASFQLHLLPSAGARGVALRLRESDLELTHIDGGPFEPGGARLDPRRLQAPALDEALLALPRATGQARVEAQSLIVLCVAGSLRSDALAAKVGQLLRVVTTGLPGASAQLPAGELLQEARAWGPACESIFNAITSTARGIALKRRSELTPLQRHFSERVELAKVEPGLQASARSITVLKRPK